MAAAFPNPVTPHRPLCSTTWTSRTSSLPSRSHSVPASPASTTARTRPRERASVPSVRVAMFHATSLLRHPWLTCRGSRTVPLHSASPRRVLQHQEAPGGRCLAWYVIPSTLLAPCAQSHLFTSCSQLTSSPRRCALCASGPIPFALRDTLPRRLLLHTSALVLPACLPDLLASIGRRDHVHERIFRRSHRSFLVTLRRILRTKAFTR